MTLRALLFDVDGTLAETERHGHRVAYNRAFRELGFKFRWSAPLYRILLEASGGHERLLYFRERYRPELGIYQDLTPDAWADVVHNLKCRHFRRLLMRGEVTARPGVARLFAEARAENVRIAVVTNACHSSVSSVLRYVLGPDLLSQVDVLVEGSEVRHKKPHPEPYLRALRKLGLGADECMVIEDSNQGLRASSAAGIPTLIVQNEDTEGQNFDAAALVVDSLGEPDQTPAVIRGRLEEPYVSLDTFHRLLAQANTNLRTRSRAA